MRVALRSEDLLNPLWRMNQVKGDFESENVMQLLFELARELRGEQISFKISYVCRSHIIFIFDFLNVTKIGARLNVIAA
jgi:hypothetical protein